LAAWGQCATHQGLKHEARFVEESDVGLATPRFTEDAGELIGLPAFYLLVVALPGTSLRLVAGPVQPPAEQAADVGRVILDAEVAEDDLGYSGCGPQFVGEAVGRWPLREELFQFGQLGIAKAAFGT
jgi:hypothetical protein